MQRLRKIWQHLQKHPRQGVVLVVVMLGLGALWPTAARADLIETGVITVLNWIFQAITYILGTLLVTFIDILVWIAQYNDFINAPAVQTGWSVTRDIANMFFIVALLLISIGTVFRIQEYRYTSMLRKLIIMAILINFSKTIAAFFIDLSQVVMLTFVNAFKDMAAGNLTQGFGIDKIVSFSRTASASGGDINLLSVAGAMFAAVVMLFIALVVVGIFVILLAQRIVMLWIYIVLAPTAYMVAVLPGSLGSWWGSWWRDFSQYLIRGPVIAFFLWLALTIISLSNSVTGNNIINVNSTLRDSAGPLGGTNISNTNSQAAFASEATTSANIINYIIAIGMLVAGLQQATKASGVAGNVAGKWMGNLNRWGGNLGQAPFKAVSKAGGYAAGQVGDVLKRPGNAIVGGLLNVGSKLPLVGGTFQDAKARFRQRTQRQEDKETAFTKFESLAELASGATGVAVGASGVARRKARRERLLQSPGYFSKLDAKQQDEVLRGYQNDIGMSVVTAPNGKLAFSATDNDGLKVLKDVYKKNPALMSRFAREARDEASSSNNLLTRSNAEARAEFWTSQMANSVKEMKVSDIADMSSAAWLDDDFAKLGLSALDKKDKKFINKTKADVPTDIQEAIAEARVRLNMPERIEKKEGEKDEDEEVLAQEEINRRRQQRTEELRNRRGEDFEKSAEYLADPSKYYSKQQYQQNARQQQRVMDRLAGGKAGVSEITSMRRFGTGKSNTLAVSEALLAQAGVKPTAGGYTRNPESVKRIAGVFNQQLQGDVEAIETELAELAAQERELNTPTSNLVDASGKPMTRAQADPQKLADIEARRSVLDTRKDAIRTTQMRLQDPSKLEDLTFINADRSGGSARNILAEEAMHKKIEAMDADGSVRANMKAQFTPEEFQNIVDEQRQRSDNPKMSEQRAFDEYLAKGLVNQGRWADTSPDAVKLKPGMALALKAQAEAKNMNLGLTATDEAELEDVTVPPAAGPGRKLREGVRQTLDNIQGVNKVDTPRPKVITESADAQRERVLNFGKQMDANVKRDAFVQAQQEAASAQATYAALRKEKDAQAKNLQKSYAENESIYNDKTKSKAERDKAYDLMGVYRNEIAKVAADLEPARKAAETARSKVSTSQSALRSSVAATTPPPPTPAARPQAKPAGSPRQSTERGNYIEEERGGGNVTNVTNVTQNITQAFKAAPPEIRGKLQGITADVLDSALKNSIVWRGLMSYIKNNAAEVEKSEKLSDLGRKELQKRIGSMEKHVQEGNAEEFKNEFGQFQNIINSSSGEES